MEGINQDFSVLPGNRSTEANQYTGDILIGRKYSLENLRVNPELHEVTEGPLYEFSKLAKSALNEKLLKLGIKPTSKETPIFLASTKHLNGDNADHAQTLEGQLIPMPRQLLYGTTILLIQVLRMKLI